MLADVRVTVFCSECGREWNDISVPKNSPIVIEEYVKTYINNMGEWKWLDRLYCVDCLE